MKRTIIFSKNAEKSLFELFEYLEIKWTEKVKNKFIIKSGQSNLFNTNRT